MAKQRMTLTHAQAEFMTRHQRSRAEKTLENYQSCFNRFNETIRGGDLFLDNVTPAHIDTFIDQYEHGPSANKQLGKLRTFFAWCVKRQYTKRNPCDPVDARPVVREGARTKHRIPQTEWDRVLDAAESYHPLDRVVIACGMYLGSRGSELRGITLGDIERGEDGVIERVKVTRGKQNWSTVLPVCPELGDEIEKWLAWYGDKHPNLGPNAYLLPPRVQYRQDKDRLGRWGYGDADNDVNPYRPMSAAAHGKIIKRALQATGYYTRGEGTHTLRRSVAAALYEEDIERGYSEALDTVRTFLGHKQTSTTEGYIGTSFSERKLEERLVRKHMFRSNRVKADPNVVPIRQDQVG